MCKGMVDPGFSSDPKNTKATETRKTVEPIFRGGGGRKGHGEVLAGWKTRRQSRVETRRSYSKEEQPRLPD